MYKANDDVTVECFGEVWPDEMNALPKSMADCSHWADDSIKDINKPSSVLVKKECWKKCRLGQ